MAVGGDFHNGGAVCGYTLDPDDPSTWPTGVTVDPETVDETDLPTCERDPHGDHDRCGLHLAPEDRPADFDAAEAVASQLNAVTDAGEMTAGPDGTASLVGIHLATLDFEDIATYLDESQLTTIDLRFARVEETLAFPSAEITQRMRLDGAAIGRIMAPRTIFERDISLTRALIGNPDRSGQQSASQLVLNFSNATIESTLSLRDAHITGNISLSEITPLGRLFAMDATIDGLLSLDGTTVQNQTRLTDVRCEQLSAEGANLHRAELENLTVQQTATLETLDVWGVAGDGEIKVGTAMFGGPVLLNEATFHTPATLQGVTIGGQLELQDAVFDGKIDLQDATFSAPVDATGAEFHASLQGSESRFDERVTFDEATFSGSVQFDNAVFRNHAYFDRATFHDTAVFNNSEFRADCFFRATAADQTPAAERSTSDAAPTAAAAVTDTTAETDTEESTAVEREPVSDGGQIETVGVFNSSVSFKRTTVRGQADFRVLKTDPEADDSFSHEAEIVPDAITVAGTFSAPEAVLTDAELAGFGAGDEIDLRSADLAGANLRQADLRGALAERATFSHANCFATDFRNARLHGAVFEGTRIDDRTEFGDQVIYDTEAEEATDPDTKRTRIEEAISLYSQLETLARDNGQQADSRTMFVNRKDAQRRRIPLVDRKHSIPRFEFQAGSKIATALDWLDFFLATLKWLVMNYGESYRRVVFTSLVIIFSFGLVFPLFDLRHALAGPLTYQGSLGEAVLFGTLYSLSAFTSLGLGQFEPGPWAEGLAVAEAGVGILMFGLLLFVLQRRTAR